MALAYVVYGFSRRFVLCFQRLSLYPLLGGLSPPPEKRPRPAEMVENLVVPPGSLSYYCWWLELATGCAALERGTPRHLGEGYSPGPYPGCPATTGSVT